MWIKIVAFFNPVVSCPPSLSLPFILFPAGTFIAYFRTGQSCASWCLEIFKNMQLFGSHVGEIFDSI